MNEWVDSNEPWAFWKGSAPFKGRDPRLWEDIDGNKRKCSQNLKVDTPGLILPNNATENSDHQLPHRRCVSRGYSQAETKVK